MNIIYEDKDKIIVNKPSGQLSQSGKNFDLDLVSEVLNYRRSKQEDPYAAIINRLDRPVSGLVLIAKNKAAAGKYSKISTFNKQYVAIVCGKLSENSGEFVDYLVKDGKNNESNVISEEKARSNNDAKLAKLTYEVIDYDAINDITRVKINLITGRHHQIRVQFASRGYVLLGDYKYMDKYCTDIMNKSDMDKKMRIVHLTRNQIALCAVSLDVDGNSYSVNPEF